ncbi:ABC transporter substrate-binding protein [Rhizobium sp. YK2]|uniref:ABC transporter substrate-binding protein n=1 Tax=Rhizobium sp. YK2 TaxID=1860096 RepID=UPI00084CD8CE|nr:ABC transporter substrate-binding protein [Rhizobium sp. YK2]OED00692.1 ABC transporter substrate-binding protein [Rhizobium sp. YK2]
MKSSLLALTLSGSLIAMVTTAAHADDIVVGEFGGSFAKAAEACHAQPFTKATGNTVTTQLGSSSQFASMIRATGGQSDFDAVYIDDSFATQLAAEGLLDKLDISKLSNGAQVAKGAIGDGDYFVQYQWSATLIAYNPKLVKEPPTSWEDLFRPEYAGKIALPDISGTSGVHFLIAMNRLKGGDLTNLDKGFEAVKALKPSVVTFYTQPDQIISMFERGEVAIAPFYPDRATIAADSGAPIAIAYPKEGAIGIKVTMVIPKGAKHPEAALKYIDTVLSADAQKCFAEKMYAGPVNTAVKLNDKTASVVPPDMYGKLYFPDPAAIAKNVGTWRQRFQREVTR